MPASHEQHAHSDLVPACCRGALSSRFLGPYSQHGYGYGGKLDALHKGDQFPQLRGLVYLDHAAATPYTAGQVHASSSELTGRLFANPHSHLGPWDATQEAVQELRTLTLEMCNASGRDYEVRSSILGPCISGYG